MAGHMQDASCGLYIGMEGRRKQRCLLIGVLEFGDDKTCYRRYIVKANFSCIWLLVSLVWMESRGQAAGCEDSQGYGPLGHSQDERIRWDFPCPVDPLWQDIRRLAHEVEQNSRNNRLLEDGPHHNERP